MFDKKNKNASRIFLIIEFTIYLVIAMSMAFAMIS